MVNDYFVIEGSSSEFDLNGNDKLLDTDIKITTEEEGENFWIGVTMTADNQVFELPVRGLSSSGSQYVSFDWLIDYGDGTDIIHETGIGSPSGLVTGHNYATAGNYIIKVIPGSDNPNYGWARAFGCGENQADGTKPFITNGGKFSWMSLAYDATSVGNYFNYSKYVGCDVLTVPEDTSDWFISGSQPNNFNENKYIGCIKLVISEDTSGWSISGSQGTNFNIGKYQGCSELSTPEDTSGWSISGTQEMGFNAGKYQGCSELTEIEDTSGWSISGSQGKYFNYYKYNDCVILTDPEDTSGWSISGSQENYFDYYKYSGCIKLTNPEDTSGWSISGNQGNNFNRSKYQNCDVLSSLENWSSFGNLTTTANSATNYLCYYMYYLDNPNTTLTGNTTVMRGKFPDPITPIFELYTFHNRTGLDDYDNLDPNWK